MQDFYPRPRSPFDASALERLRRMGLAGADGQADQDAMAVFAHIFAGQFFDDLCDYYQNSGAVRDLLVQMLDSAGTAEPKQREPQAPLQAFLCGKVYPVPAAGIDPLG